MQMYDFLLDYTKIKNFILNSLTKRQLPSISGIQDTPFSFFAFSDVFVVVVNLSVGSVLPCIILGESLVKKFVVQFFQVALYISYIVRRSGFIHVVCEEIPVVMFNAAVV